MVQQILFNPLMWIMTSILFLVLNLGFGILFFFLYKRTCMGTELRAFFTSTPIALFFQDNKFVDIKTIAPINGVVNDKRYGPFIVSSTYIDNHTKNIILPFDVDFDTTKKINTKRLVEYFKNVTNNEKSISDLRYYVSNDNKKDDELVNSLTSHIKYAHLKSLINSCSPHNIKGKIEKMVSVRVNKFANADPMQAMMVFGGIFGMIVVAAILINTMGMT